MESTTTITPTTTTTVKMSLEKFLIGGKNSCLHDLIQLHVLEMNKLVTEGYHLLYLHSLRLLAAESPLPPFTQRYLLQILHAVSSRGSSRGMKNAINEEIEETKKLYYSELRRNRLDILSRQGIGHLLYEAATDMVTSIVNNIIIHFEKRQFKFLKILNPRRKRSYGNSRKKSTTVRKNQYIIPNWRTHSKKISEIARKHSCQLYGKWTRS